MELPPQTPEDPWSCPVCFDDKQGATVTLPCKHSCCLSCCVYLCTHKKTAVVCPLCRAPFYNREDVIAALETEKAQLESRVTALISRVYGPYADAEGQGPAIWRRRLRTSWPKCHAFMYFALWFYFMLTMIFYSVDYLNFLRDKKDQIVEP